MESPEALLKSALEKIVYFEARSQQLSQDLAGANDELTRLRHESAQASQREIDLRRLLAELEVRLSRAGSEREEMARTVEALRRERTELIGKILEASKLHGLDQPTPAETFDLAQFIAELRSEVMAKRGTVTAEPPLPPTDAIPLPGVDPVAESKVAQTATAYKTSGRLNVSATDVSTLERAFPFPGRTEETLFGFSVRELQAPDASARIRAADRLKALGHPAAAPALATALHSESDPKVLVALLGAFTHFAKAEGVAVVEPLLTSPSPDVRVCSLKALLAMDAPRAGAQVAQAIKDPDPKVRRRASMLALSLSGPAALDLGESAVKDADSDVRALAALVLGASGAEKGRALLFEALKDNELKVRKAAAQALARMLGQRVDYVVAMEESQRRREVRRLATLPYRPIVANIKAVLADGKPQARVSVAVVDEVQAAQVTQKIISEALCTRVLSDLRAAIRGRTLETLAQGINEAEEDTARACAVLESRGHVVRRGAKYFVA